MKQRIAILLAAPVLCACAAQPPQGAAAAPMITADSVLQVQYRAQGSHGGLSGEEADKIHKDYVEKIGVAAPPSATEPMAQGGK